MSAAAELEQASGCILQSIRDQMSARAFQAAVELRNSALKVLSGSRSGRIYRVPGTRAHYQASAPGEPPAVRTGNLRGSWSPITITSNDTYRSRIESHCAYADALDTGSSRVAARPYKNLILKGAEKKVIQIYKKHFF